MQSTWKQAGGFGPGGFAGLCELHDLIQKSEAGGVILDIDSRDKLSDTSDFGSLVNTKIHLAIFTGELCR